MLSNNSTKPADDKDRGSLPQEYAKLSSLPKTTATIKVTNSHRARPSPIKSACSSTDVDDMNTPEKNKMRSGPYDATAKKNKAMKKLGEAKFDPKPILELMNRVSKSYMAAHELSIRPNDSDKCAADAQINESGADRSEKEINRPEELVQNMEVDEISSPEDDPTTEKNDSDIKDNKDTAQEAEEWVDEDEKELAGGFRYLNLL